MSFLSELEKEQGATGDPMGSALYLQTLCIKHNEKQSLPSPCLGTMFLYIFTWGQSLSRFPSMALAGPSENCKLSRKKLTHIIIKQGLERPSYMDLLHRKPL